MCERAQRAKAAHADYAEGHGDSGSQAQRLSARSAQGIRSENGVEARGLDTVRGPIHDLREHRLPVVSVVVPEGVFVRITSGGIGRDRVVDAPMQRFTSDQRPSMVFVWTSSPTYTLAVRWTQEWL
jgi:hypothetical protein